MKEVIVMVILFIASMGAFVLSFFSFKEKGFLINSAYIYASKYASKNERNSIDKKPHYRQSAMAFFGIGIIFLLKTIEMILGKGWIFYIVLAVMLVTLFYGIGFGILIEMKKK